MNQELNNIVLAWVHIVWPKNGFDFRKLQHPRTWVKGCLQLKKEKHPVLPGWLKHAPNCSLAFYLTKVLHCLSTAETLVAILCGDPFLYLQYLNMCLMTKRGPFLWIRLSLYQLCCSPAVQRFQISVEFKKGSQKHTGRRCSESFESLINKMHDG